MKQVVILAGGKGTRLRERLGDLPKPLIDICGVPLLERQILLAKRFGFEKVLVLVNYRAEAIIEFCQKNNNWGLKIQCIDDGVPCGTAGAVLKVLDLLDDEFLVMYGDTMLDVDLQRFYDFHRAKDGVDCTLFLHPNDHPHDSDLVEVDNQAHILGFFPYPHSQDLYYPNLVNAALYWIRKSSLEPWRGYSGGILDFGKHLFPAMIEKGFVLRGYNSPEYIKDCGTPARIDKVCADFQSGKIVRSSLSHQQMAVFLDRDGTINREIDHLNSVDQFELLPGVEEAIRRLNQSEYRVCVVTNQPVIARGECSYESLREIHNKLETILGRKGAFVDRIYYCPHHPDKGFQGEVPDLKIKCDCRKPNTGMIDAAITELNIASRRSWLIGDSTSDLQTARNAGLKSILVETGYAGMDDKYWAVPDFVVPNLTSAVSLIVDIYPRLYHSLKEMTANIELGEVVFIGGQSRSGKSSCASVIRDVLRARGLQCHVIATDRWLLGESDREPGVLGRHNAMRLNELIGTLYSVRSKTERIALPFYQKKLRNQVANIHFYDIEPQDVVVFEGVVALHFALSLHAHNQFFVDIDETIRKQRVINEYIMRGYTIEESETIYQDRLLEEVPWILETASEAVRISVP